MYLHLGFYHEQSRSDRDAYVSVNWRNVPDLIKNNFDVRKDIDSLGTKYDYLSIMHYAQNAFAPHRR